MNEEFEPRTEAKGALAPPNRRPPTAVGVGTPPPPRPPFRRVAVSTSVTAFRPLYVFTASSVAAGTILWFLAPWLVLKVTGASFVLVGLFFATWILWVNSGASAAWRLRREHRAIRKRQHALGQSPRTSA
jgi:hypothetical protein